MQKIEKRAIAIECSDNDHDDCTPVRDAIIKFKPITEAYTTSVMEGNSIYCVAGTAVGTSTELATLKKKIKNLRTKTRGLEVKKVEMY